MPINYQLIKLCLRLVCFRKFNAMDEISRCLTSAAIHKPPSDWKRHPGRPNHTWCRAIELDQRPQNIGPSYTWKKAASRTHWRSIVDTTMLKKSMPWRESMCLSNHECRRSDFAKVQQQQQRPFNGL